MLEKIIVLFTYPLRLFTVNYVSVGSVGTNTINQKLNEASSVEI